MSSSTTEPVGDCPVDWVAAHIRAYVESGGMRGPRRGGRRSLLLTTRGRRSGLLRRVALYYGQDEDRYVLVASNSGASSDPLWYRNLLAEPRGGGEVEVAGGADDGPAVVLVHRHHQIHP